MDRYENSGTSVKFCLGVFFQNTTSKMSLSCSLGKLFVYKSVNRLWDFLRQALCLILLDNQKPWFVGGSQVMFDEWVKEWMDEWMQSIAYWFQWCVRHSGYCVNLEIFRPCIEIPCCISTWVGLIGHLIKTLL